MADKGERRKGNDDYSREFTQIELLAVITVIAILASLLLPALSLANDNTCGVDYI